MRLYIMNCEYTILIYVYLVKALVVEVFMCISGFYLFAGIYIGAVKRY